MRDDELMQAETRPAAGRAEPIRLKLAEAIEVLAGLQARGAELVLEASEGKPAAEKMLAAHRERITHAERHVAELQRAHALAERLDAEAEADRQAAAREAAYSAFAAAAGRWEDAGTRLALLIEQAAAVRIELALAGEEMQRRWPTGIANLEIQPRMLSVSTDRHGELTISLDAAIAGEAFRNGRHNADLPGAAAPWLMAASNRPAIEPLANAFKRSASLYITRLRAAVDRLKPQKDQAA
ncbi:hypothetical protein [Bradyrhizobium oligotrophicum]|uniref:hypothetical protein n=1 Tax=Bradyrhizobium oligotrophicum TaxID=44255 RepID=UPI003EB83004